MINYQLPLWRGFNLPNLFTSKWDQVRLQFLQNACRWISDWGFNFVRIPLDCRFYVKDGDLGCLDIGKMREIADAVALAKFHRLHVCINLHRAPGYCINSPREHNTLWTDESALKTCEQHWSAWATLLSEFDSQSISFNLLNEPRGVSGSRYAEIAQRLINAIREQSPERLVLLDGLDGGMQPVQQLVDIGSGQLLRGYAPFDLTHFGADWTGEWSGMPHPVWPRVGFNGYLYGPQKRELQKPLRIVGNRLPGGMLRMRVGMVSSEALLVVRADGQEVFRRHFRPGPGEGEWNRSVFSSRWQIYQNEYDVWCSASIPSGTCVLDVEVILGDWLSLNALTVQVPGSDIDIPCTSRSWGQEPGEIFLSESGGHAEIRTGIQTTHRLLEQPLEKWLRLRQSGVNIMVGEWGAHNKTPHSVVLAWMEDQLRLWQRAGLGWAFWSLSGSFGVLDSDRPDVNYANWYGHKLDEKMLELLRRY
jgi:hypothetical protein